MVECIQCKHMNPAERKTCSYCASDLLPDMRRVERILTMTAALVMGGLCAYLAALLSSRGSSLALPLIVLAAALPLAGLYNAVRGYPLHERYARRGRRHIALDPQQASADFAAAIQAAPPAQKTRLTRERTALNEKLGLADNQRSDLANAVRALNQSMLAAATEEKPGLLKDLAGLHAELGDTQSETRALLAAIYATETLSVKTPEGAGNEPGQVLAERQELMRQGRVAAFGFCPACQRQVELTFDLLCPTHPQAKIKMLIFAAVKEKS